MRTAFVPEGRPAARPSPPGTLRAARAADLSSFQAGVAEIEEVCRRESYSLLARVANPRYPVFNAA